MKVLLDENLPHDLRHELIGHDVFTVRYMRWNGMKNGALLATAAAAGFDAMITMDTGVDYQQNPAMLPLSVVILEAPSNDIDDLRRESIVNKTGISAATNRTIGGRAPSAYFKQLVERSTSTAEVVAGRITGHHIDAELLQADAFDDFFDARRQALLALIGGAMGKAVAEPAVPALAEEYELDGEEPTDDDVAEVLV